ncbi:MAG: hypothetical protein V1933_03575 [Candidatus Omnitrophota bacterium]
MVNFAEITSSSIKWAKTVSLERFSVKKWLMLAFVALMAGYLVNGCNSLNFNNNSGDGRSQQTQSAQISGSTETATAPSVAAQTSKPAAAAPSRVIIISIVAAIISVVLILTILMMWLASRFSFVFIENVVKNGASIKTPFKENRKTGNSYFKFNLLLTSIFLIIAGIIVFICANILIKAGVFGKSAPVGKEIFHIFLLCLPYAGALLFFILCAALIGFITREFVLVSMFKDKINIIQAWRNVLGLIKGNFGNFVMYLLIKIGLGICCGIIYALLFITAIVGLILPGAIIGFLSYLAYLIIPVSLKAALTVVIFIVIVPVVLFLIYCLMSLYLPFAVFFRAFSIKFLGALNPDYALIKDVSAEAIEPQQAGISASEKIKAQKPRTETHSPVLASILSFTIGGMGQIYNGQAGKGVLIFFTSWLIFPWLIGIIDAYKIADKLNRGQLVIERKNGRLITSAVVMIMLLLTVFILFVFWIAIAPFLAPGAK